MSIEYSRALSALKTALSTVVDGRVSADQIDAETMLFDADPSSATLCLDIDSLGALDAITLVEQALGVRLPDDVDFSGLASVGDVAQLIAARV